MKLLDIIRQVAVLESDPNTATSEIKSFHIN